MLIASFLSSRWKCPWTCFSLSTWSNLIRPLGVPCVAAQAVQCTVPEDGITNAMTWMLLPPPGVGHWGRYLHSHLYLENFLLFWYKSYEKARLRSWYCFCPSISIMQKAWASPLIPGRIILKTTQWETGNGHQWKGPDLQLRKRD